jgi:hypothetical protein
MKPAMFSLITIYLNESVQIRNVKEPVDLRQADGKKKSFRNSKYLNCKR